MDGPRLPIGGRGQDRRKGREMSTDEPYLSPDMMEPPLRKKGMSTGVKVLIVLAILFLLIVLLCCGGLVATVIWLGKATSKDPQVVRQKTAEMIQIDVPEVLAPTMSFTMKVPFSDQTLLTWVVYVEGSSQSTLVLVSFGDVLAEQDQGEMRRQIDQQLQEEGIGAAGNVEDWQGHEKEISIRDEPVTFNFVTGKDINTGAQRIDVTGTIQGNTGPVMLILSTDTETLDEPAIVEMLESIK